PTICEPFLRELSSPLYLSSFLKPSLFWGLSSCFLGLSSFAERRICFFFAAPPSPASFPTTRRRSFSGLRVGVNFALAIAAFFAAISLRFFGETAPVTAVP